MAGGFSYALIGSRREAPVAGVNDELYIATGLQVRDGAVCGAVIDYNQLNGFVRAVADAFQAHHGVPKLVVRDDDDGCHGKRKAWIWNDQRKVVILLGNDKAVLLESEKDSVSMKLVVYAQSLDLDRIEKTLTKPPRTDFRLTTRTFSVFSKGTNVFTSQQWAGLATSWEVVGRKQAERVRWLYKLEDGSKVIVVSVHGRVDAITHETASGRVELLK